MVSETGKQILAGLAETRQLFGQISLLIQTADSMLGEAGWECFTGNRCAELTGHIHRPHQWMPQNIYRFYEQPDGENGETTEGVILFIGVLLDREGAWSGFQEPWLTFGLYQFLPGHTTQRFRYEEWVEAPLEDKHDPDGSFRTWHNPASDPEENEGLLHQAVAAIPLVSIQGAEDLKHHVIDPLLKLDQDRLPDPDNP